MNENIFNRLETKEKRRSLRSSMPEPEKRLWQRLRGRQLEGHKFRRQHGIGPYIVDFYCPKLNIAIEIDGDTHFSDLAEAHDFDRDQYIASVGVSTMRFTNQDVCENIDGVISAVLRALKR